MPRTKPTAKRSTGLYEERLMDGTSTIECCIARKKPRAHKGRARLSQVVDLCCCALDCTGVCHEHFPEDHYVAWCLRFGPPPNGYPYEVPDDLSGEWCAPPKISEASESDESSAPRSSTPCLECGYDMGPESTRQLCGKTVCDGLGYDSDETEPEPAESFEECIEDDTPPPEYEPPKDEPLATKTGIETITVELPNPCSELSPRIPPYEWNVFIPKDPTKPLRPIDFDRLTRNTIGHVNHHFPWLNKVYPDWQDLYRRHLRVDRSTSISEFISDKLYCLYAVFERKRLQRIPVGTMVQAKYMAQLGNDGFYDGRIELANDDGTYAIQYDDGDVEGYPKGHKNYDPAKPGVRMEHIRVVV
jgi:hypothetical protein